jgi:acyl-CoA hydrolase
MANDKKNTNENTESSSLPKSKNNAVEFCFLAEPTDVNFGGKVHGGMVMKWIDQASYACAAKWSKRYSVTISANGIRFIRPILVGQMITVNAQIVHTGTSSMHIYVVVRACDPKVQNYVVTNRCFITFMATDESGYPVKVSKYLPITKEEQKLEQVAMHAKDFAIKLDLDFEKNLGWK